MPSTVILDRPHRAIRPIGWPLERVLFALAGTMTLVGAALSAFVSPWFLLLGALVGVNQWLFVLFGACPASLILRRRFSLPSVLYPAPEGHVARRAHFASCGTSSARRSAHSTTPSKP